MFKITCRVLKFLYVLKALHVMLGKCFLAELHSSTPSTILLFAMMYLFFVNLLIYCLCGTWVCAHVCKCAHAGQVQVEARGQHQVCSSIALSLLL